ncbi:Stomatin protein 2 mitochondrial, partial [Fasciolopsis buskii]
LIFLRYLQTLSSRRWLALRTPINTGILFVPEKEAWVIERLGKFHKALSPGLNFCIPLVDRIAYVQSLKEVAIEIPDQSAITSDNVVLHLNGVLFLKVKDPYKASYGVAEADFAITQLAQTTMRSEIGKINLDNVFKEREALNLQIVHVLGKAAEPWGIECLRYEIRDIQLPQKIKEAMQMQVEADRKKRAAILESEGQRESAINRAEGMKRSQVLASEGERTQITNKALGEAEAIRRLAESRAEAVRLIAAAIEAKHGASAVQLAVAEQYIEAFSELAKQTNTVLLPAQTGDVASMVAQALTIFKATNGPPSHPVTPVGESPTTKTTTANTTPDSSFGEPGSGQTSSSVHSRLSGNLLSTSKQIIKGTTKSTQNTQYSTDEPRDQATEPISSLEHVISAR